MKKKTGLLSLFLVLALVLVLLPGLQTEAEAAAADSITICGMTVKSGQYFNPTNLRVFDTEPLSQGYMYYKDGVLTMMNPNRSHGYGIVANGDLSIKLEQSGYLEISTTGIDVSGNLKFIGSGSLTLKTTGNYSAIKAGGSLEFAQTGKVIVSNTTGANCVYAEKNITVTSGVVDVTSQSTGYAAVRSAKGGIVVDGGELTVESEFNGIQSLNAFSQRGGIVTVTSSAGTGILVENSTSNAVVYSGKLTITAHLNGIQAQKLYVYGGRGIIESKYRGNTDQYSAVKIAYNSASGFVTKPHVRAETNAGYTVDYANLGTLDCVIFYSSIKVNGVEVRDGRYLPSGNKLSTSLTKPSSGGYAYYENNTLYLNNYVGNNDLASGVYSQNDLTIVLEAGSTNKLTTSYTSGTTYCGVKVDGVLKVRGLGSLSIYGGKYAISSTGNLTMSSTQVIGYSSGLHSGGNMDLTNAIVGVYQFGTHSAGTHAIQATGDINISGALGTLYINNPDKADGNYVRGIVGKNITINSPVGITSSGLGIRGEGNVTIKGGTIEVNAKGGSGIVATGTMTIAGGTVDVTAYNNGLAANKLIVTGGRVTAVSTHTSNDKDNKAIDVPGDTTAYFQIPNNYAFTANISSTPSYNQGYVSELSDYDYVCIGDFVMMHGVEVPSGYYLPTGNSSKTVTTTKPSGGYAHYENGFLTLHNYSYSGEAIGVQAYADLTIGLSGTSTLDVKGKQSANSPNDAIRTGRSLTIYGDGSGKLILKSASGSGLLIGGDLNMLSDTVSSTGSAYYSVEVRGNFNMKGGTFTSQGTKAHALYAKKNVTVSGGLMTLQTTNNFCAYVDSGNLTVSGGTVSINSSQVTALEMYLGNLTISGGELYARGNADAIILTKGRLNMSGGYLEATSLRGDSGDRALQLAGTNSNYYNVSSQMAAGASTTIGTLSKLDPAQLNNYRRVIIGQYVMVGDVMVKSGQSINASGTVVQGNGGKGYAYYKSGYSDNSLTLNGFVLDKSDFNISGIVSFASLSLSLTGNDSSITCGNADGIQVYGNLLVTGTKALTVNAGGDAISVDGNVILDSASLNLKSKNTALRSTARMTVNSGHLVADGSLYGIYAEVVKVLDGQVLAYGADDAQGYAIYYGDEFYYADSLYAAGSYGDWTQNGKVYDSENHTSYDFLCIGDYVMLTGTIIPDGYTLVGGDAQPKSEKYADLSTYSNGVLTLQTFIKRYSEGTAGNQNVIYAPHDLTINLADTGEIETNQHHCIYIDGSLRITGTGSLLCHGIYREAVFLMNGNLQVDSGTVTIESKVLPLRANSGDVIVNGGTLTCTVTGENSDGWSALSALNVCVTGGTLNAQGGIYASWSVEITGGTVNATGNSLGIELSDNKSCRMSVSGGTVIARGNADYGIMMRNGILTVTGGSLDVTGNKNGVLVDKFNMTGGTFKALSQLFYNDYYAVSAGEFTVGPGLVTYGETTIAGTDWKVADTSKLNYYQQIKIEKGNAPAPGATVSGTVTSYLVDGIVTIKLYKSGSSTPAYTTTVTGAKGSPTAYAISGVATGTYTLEFSKNNHVTRTYTVTVGSSGVMQEARICPIGDVTGDGKVNMKDWNRLYEHLNEVNLLTDYALQCADVTGDGKKNMKDWNRLYEHLNEINPLW